MQLTDETVREREPRMEVDIELRTDCASSAAIVVTYEASALDHWS